MTDAGDAAQTAESLEAAEPWYVGFFGEAFWAVASHEYDAVRTEREAGYLEAVLKESAPGPRVLDLGCGTGRHAIALAQRGFDVTGVDVNAWAIDQAAASSAAVRWRRLDLLRDLPWPWDDGTFDALVCVQSFGWGSDAQQLRLLREARRVLAPGGLLVLDHSSILAIARHFAPHAVFEADGLRADFHRSFQAVRGRSVGRIEVTRAGADPVGIHDDVRLYQPAEVRDLVERAGFVVERADAEFAAGSAPEPASRYVQFLARKPAKPPAALAWWNRSDEHVRLDLRWTPDEFEFVRDAVESALAGVTVEVLREYHLDDPFGGVRAAPVLAEHFGVPLSADMVTAGGGATGLLHSLAVLAGPGPLVHLPGGHPDLPRWAAEFGARTMAVPFQEAAACLDRESPSVVVVDRPSILGESYAGSAIEDLVHAARRYGTVVVLDESYATYAGPDASCVPLVAEHDNLVIVRSVSKGYCCGGLRVGFAVAAPALTRRLREVAPPLAANSAGMAAALRLLAQGDIFGGLRERIAVVKPEVCATLRRAGLPVSACATDLPWVIVEADEAELVKRGVAAKTVRIGAERSVLKVALPLSEERLTLFREVFAEADGAS